MSDQFYRAFEERYYASQATIKSLRRQYLTFVEPLAQIYSGASTFDAGCGRGEWLELLQESGFDAHGVDLSDRVGRTAGFCGLCSFGRSRQI